MKSRNYQLPPFGFGRGFGRLIQDAFEGLDDIGDLFHKPGRQSTHRFPTALHQDENHFFVTAELPGVPKDSIKLEFLDGTLKIGASASRETSDGRKNFDLTETVSFPELIGDGGLTASLEDGILTVRLPKAEEVKPRSISID